MLLKKGRFLGLSEFIISDWNDCAGFSNEFSLSEVSKDGIKIHYWKIASELNMLMMTTTIE